MAKYQLIGAVQSTWFGRFLMVGPNSLTLARAALAPLVFVFAVAEWAWWSVAVYAVGLLTDFLDGTMARTFASGTPFGRAMDSAADKILVFAGLLALERLDSVPSWLLLTFVLREFLTFGLRAVHMPDGSELAKISDVWGRLRFVILHIGLVMMLLPSSVAPAWFGWTGKWIVITAVTVAWLAFVFYCKRDLEQIRASMKRNQGLGVS